MGLRGNYNHTKYACFIGYITQAIINNFAPLLFLTFQKEYSISLDKITLLITLNFGFQLLVDFASSKYADRIGYRRLIVAAHAFAVAGLVGLAVLPSVFPTPFSGLICAIALYAVGSGIIEVLVSPIIEACPTDKKEQTMSLLHSFYCWGHVLVVVVSTLFFVTVGIGSWKILACVWALIPLFNIFYFSRVPIDRLVDENAGMSFRQLFSKKLFWILIVLMICSGASEQAMSQWASTFAELGLKVSKTIGDLAGPCFFAILMGCSRMFYARFGDKIKLERFMAGSCLLCVASYLLAVFSPYPLLALLGCGLSGLSVGILWPGTFSIAARSMPTGGTALFALLALAGDVGCATGPTVVGTVSGHFSGRLQTGLLMAIVFPVAMLFFIRLYKRRVPATAREVPPAAKGDF